MSNAPNLENSNTNDARERLYDAEEKAIENPSFQPHGSTHCNQATASVAKAMGAPMGPFLDKHGTPLLANQMAQNLSSPRSGYHTVSQEQAKEIANHGGFVVATGVGLGHIEPVALIWVTISQAADL